MEVLVAVISGAFALITAVGVALINRQNKHLAEVKNQVRNNHSTNLRDDVDEVLDAVDRVLRVLDKQDAMLRKQASDIGRLRAELRTERRERQAADQRLEERASI